MTFFIFEMNIYKIDKNHLSAFKGCVIGGAIGDACGHAYEGQDMAIEDISILHSPWCISDDTQLTLATYESIITHKNISPEHIASTFVRWFNLKKISGVGSATLKALQELQIGGHWALVGRKGEYAAGNGAAMRIAPLSFFLDPLKFNDRLLIRDVCRITHHNEEAYAGAMAIILAINFFLTQKKKDAVDFLNYVIKGLPDSNTRDRLGTMVNEPKKEIAEVASTYGVSAYVCESVPFAIFAASKIFTCDFKSILEQIISCGGDTDTNSAMAGQIIGTYLGGEKIPYVLSEKLATTNFPQLFDGLID